MHSRRVFDKESTAMFRSTRAIIAGVLLFGASACMTEQTAPRDLEAIQAERLANTLTIIESCRASECGRLDLDRGRLTDFGAISDMTHVTALMMSFTDFDDLSDIAPMSQLRELHIGQTAVTDLSGLVNFPNLHLLHAQDLDVNDYAAVGRLTQLEELVIGSRGLVDLGFVSGLQRLKRLDINSSNVTDLSPLTRLSSLETLDMVAVELPADLTPLLRIPSLKMLNISGLGTLNPEQQSVVDQLTERGVEFAPPTIMMPC